ncbi:ureidoglycolate lyase [Roseibium denhamense]|uniref:Ureidoglycolate lyase n=1 Tax=Roseibium denhamense TaxID=76305 RepID=A0ABY1PG90_9HYPH|nr:ureidoglycolate lyase [Roseibium denhamense]MTI04759.1 ureidoglycolate lyase [Roseibium denhamense]SMP33471.1 ureidoglycolate lyase [Roseibium denhamense]
MSETIFTQPLTADLFAPFGDVLEAAGTPDKIINQGKCGRYHDLAAPDIVGDGARAGISLFHSEKRTLPYKLELVERHPLGSQAFIPMTQAPFLVIVCPDENGRPGRPLAFTTAPGQGINLHRGTWHGVLTPLADPGLFAVVDRIGDGDNLEEFWFDEPFLVAGST